MKVHFLDRGSFPSHLNLTPPRGITSWLEFEQTTTDQCLSHCQNADIILTNKVILTRNILQNLPALKLICVTATGVNNVDLVACKELGIKVVNAVDYGTASVAEHVLMLMLNLARNLPTYLNATAKKSWSESDFFCDLVAPIQLLRGKTLCIVGNGTLGSGVAKLSEAFGMKILYAERRNATQIREGYTTFDTAVSHADFVTLHCPLDDSTHQLINKQSLTLFKPTAFLINCGRGPLVHEADLLTALQTFQLAGAALDVTDKEPPLKSDIIWELAKLTNVIITPHIAWAANEAMQALLDQITAKISDFITGTLDGDLTDNCT